MRKVCQNSRWLPKIIFPRFARKLLTKLITHFTNLPQLFSSLLQSKTSHLFSRMRRKKSYSITCNYCYIQIIGVHKHRCEIMILTEIHYAQLKLLSNFSPFFVFFVGSFFWKHLSRGKKVYNELLLSFEGHLGEQREIFRNRKVERAREKLKPRPWPSHVQHFSPKNSLPKI